MPDDSIDGWMGCMIERRRQIHEALLSAPPPCLRGSISSLNLAESRLSEIRRLHQSITQAKFAGSKRAFQTLPKSLRRRAASHTPKRVPKNHRHRTLEEAQKCNPSESKQKKRFSHRPRRHMKKLCALRTTLLPRTIHDGQGGFDPASTRLPPPPKWTETHIWHAKRHHMQSLWGYRLAVKNHTKTFRVMQRAAQHQTLLYDLSYEQTFLLQGTTLSLLSLLQQMTEPHILGFASQQQQQQSPPHFGEQWLYAYGQYPKSLIAPFSYLWLPSESTFDPDLASLWLWIHPAAGDEAWQALVQAQAQTQTQISLQDWTGHLNRFELIGPTSLATLSHAIALHISESELHHAYWPLLAAIRKPNQMLPLDWFYVSQAQDPRLTANKETPMPAASSLHHKEMLCLQQLEFESQSRLRLFFSKLCKGTLEAPRATQREVDEHLRRGALESAKMHHVSTTIMDDAYMPFVMRRKKLIFSEEKKSDATSTPPLLALELIVPRGWGMPCWRRLVHSTPEMHVCSLQDRQRVLEDLCDDTLGFPHYFPGTRAFHAEQAKRMTRVQMEEQKRPKGKKRLDTMHHPFPFGGAMHFASHALLSPMEWRRSLSCWIKEEGKRTLSQILGLEQEAPFCLMARVIMLSRGRPQEGATLYPMNDRIAHTLATDFEREQSIRRKIMMAWFDDQEEMPLSLPPSPPLPCPCPTSELALSKKARPLGFVITASQGYSQRLGCGASWCYVDANDLLDKYGQQGEKARMMRVWVVNPTSFSIGYPAHLHF